MRQGIRFASNILALAASLLATLAPPAIAAPRVGTTASDTWVTRQSDGICSAREEGTLADLGEALDTVCRITIDDPARGILDDRAGLTVVLTPQFHGPRGFGEPSAVASSTRIAWSPAPLVSRFDEKGGAPLSVDQTNWRNTDPGYLTGHFFRGAAKLRAAPTAEEHGPLLLLDRRRRGEARGRELRQNDRRHRIWEVRAPEPVGDAGAGDPVDLYPAAMGVRV